MRINAFIGALTLLACGALATARAADGEAVYRQTCAACHDAGVAGAPKLGDAAAWQERRGKGIDAMLQLVIDGVQGYSGAMPPRGGNMNATDAELRAAVEFMLGQLP